MVVRGELEPIQADIAREVFYTLDIQRQATIYTHIHSYGRFRVSSQPNHNLLVFGLWEDLYYRGEIHTDMGTTCFLVLLPITGTGSVIRRSIDLSTDR